VKCDVVDSKLRFNCVSTRPKAGQMVRLHLRLLQETRQCFARTFERCERTIRYCQMRGCRETITSTRGISDAPRARGTLMDSFRFELQGPCCAFSSWRARKRYD
jgi:hypothetical protein